MKKFLSHQEIEADKDRAIELTEAAAHVVEVEGGFMLFDDYTEYQTWENQQ